MRYGGEEVEDRGELRMRGVSAHFSMRYIMVRPCSDLRLFSWIIRLALQLAMPLCHGNLSAPYSARSDAWSYQSGNRGREKLRCFNVPMQCFWVFSTQLTSLGCEEGVGWIEVDCRKGRVRDGK